MGNGQAPWLTSAEARKQLRLSTCDLAHIRVAGHLRFTKSGNAFLYDRSDCEKLAESRRSILFRDRAQDSGDSK